MGLDMYLYARKSKYTSSFREKDLHYPNELKVFEEDFLIINETTDYQIGYWRKANAIHQWFVDNCAGGEDDCRPVYIEISKLKELKELCEKVLNDHSKAKELLHTQSGFFFGSEEYDEWYFKDLEYTKQLLEKILNHKDLLDNYEIYYEASW